MPGNRASAAKGHAHQLWRARKITASAPPISRPSAVKTRISSTGAPGSSSRRFMTQFVCNGRKRKPRRRNIRPNRLAEAVQERQAPSYNIQPRNDFSQGAAASKRPGRSGERPSLVSVISVISEVISQKFLSSFCHSEQTQGLVTHFGQFEQARGRQFFQLQVGGFGQLEKLQQISQSFPGIAIG
jgi:hypothetical protein